jgi:hypothetical protein
MYKEKYLKYKTKYLDLKSQIGGDPNIIQEGGVFEDVFDWLFGGVFKKEVKEVMEADGADGAEGTEDKFFKNITADDKNTLLTLVKSKKIRPIDANHWVKSIDMINESKHELINIKHIEWWIQYKNEKIGNKMNLKEALQEANKKTIEIMKLFASLIQSKAFATAYRKQNSDSKIVNFKFYIKKDYSTTKYKIDDTNDKGTMLLDHYFIYHKNKIYMSYTGFPPYLPKLISMDINSFLVLFHLLLILINNLNLDKQNKSDFLTYLLRIASCIQIIFDINLQIDDIILQYLAILEMVKQNLDINEQHSWSFFISVDGNIFNESTMSSIHQFFINNFKPDYNEISPDMKHSKAFDINNRAQIIFQNLIVIDNEEYTRYIREYNTKNIQDDSTDIYVILATYVDTPGTYARLKK